MVLVVIAGSVVSACSTRTVLKPNPQPTTSYRKMQAPKGVARYTLKHGEVAVQPIPQKQIAPVYPPSLVHPGAAPVTVVMQLVMEKDGRVEGVFPVSNTDKGPDHGLYEAAIRQAAMQWKFTPLWMEERSPDGTAVLTRKPFSLWYSFHFKVVNGKPIVETARR
ncbi:MAG: energy transducer TonB [Rhodanobacteraceae bacterium]